jgi:hypothetical protein
MSATVVNTVQTAKTAKTLSAGTIAMIVLSLIIIGCLLALALWGNGMRKEETPKKSEVNSYYIFTMVTLGIILLVTIISIVYSVVTYSDSAIGKCQAELKVLQEKYTTLEKNLKQKQALATLMESVASLGKT